MKQLWMIMVVAVFGCSKAELPLTPTQLTTLEVIAVDEEGNSVSSADVFLDGEPVGLTPFNSQDVQPGLHALRVTREGFRIFSDQLLVQQGQRYTVEAILTPLPVDRGQVVVTVNRDSALVKIFDEQEQEIFQSYDRTSVYALAPGMYRVMAESEGVRLEEKVEIVSGQTATVNLEFQGAAPSLQFNILEDSVQLGDPISLSWQSDGVQVVVDQGIGVRGPNGSELHVCPAAGMKVFTATAYSRDNVTFQVSDSVLIKTERARAPELDFNVEQDSVEFGEGVMLVWQSDGHQVIIDQGVGTRGPQGAEEITFANPGKKVFTATAYGDNSLLTIRKDSVYVKEAPFPALPIIMLSVTRRVTVNTPVTISWQTENADYLVVDYVDAPGLQGSAETVFASPGIRIITATAFNQAGYVSASDTVEVVASAVHAVNDILVGAESSVRADRGEAGYADFDVASFEVKESGKYRVFAEVWYNSGDSQLNESYYLDITDDAGRTVSVKNANAGERRVVPDDPGEPHTSSRDSGVFRLIPGTYHMNVYHYAKIADRYSGFINGAIEGPESVKILGFKLVHISN